MEIIDPSVPRAKLILGKFPVMEVHQWGTGFCIRVKFGEVSFTAYTSVGTLDVRPGDFLTLYTEIPLKKEFQDAPAFPPPVQ
jgi:hypothetical protein